MIERLGDLLRRTLDDGGSPEVRLEEELRFLDGYLEIERTRFLDRLTVITRVDPRARLYQLYADQQSFAVGNVAGGGFEAVIEIPLQVIEIPQGVSESAPPAAEIT